MDTGENRDCGSDVAAYVLGALERDEVAGFRAHLDSCAVCRDELSAFGAVVDALPLGAPPHAAPRALKRNVMAAVRAEARAAERAQRPVRSNLWSLIPRPALGAAATALAAVAVLIGVALGGSTPGTRIIHASSSLPGSTASMRITGDRGELVVARMPAPPAGKVYEVWLQRGGGVPPSATSALFSPTSGGAAEVDVPGDMRGVRQVMVTPEPAGGSRVPTHSPVVVANL